MCSHDGGGPGVEHVVLVHIEHNLRPRRGRRPPRPQLRPEVVTVEVGGERGLEAGRGQKGGEPVGDVDKPRVGFLSISIQLHQSHTLRSWCPSSCDGEVDCGQSPRLGLRLQQVARVGVSISMDQEVTFVQHLLGPPEGVVGGPGRHAPVVGGEDQDRVVIEAGRLQRIHHPPHPRVQRLAAQHGCYLVPARADVDK